MNYLLESRGKDRRPLTLAEVQEKCHARCVMKPQTFQYFVATEDYKVIGTDKIANPGDFIVVYNKSAWGLSPTEFKEYFDICHPAYSEELNNEVE